MPNVSGAANLNCNGYAYGGVLSNNSGTWGNSGGGVQEVMPYKLVLIDLQVNIKIYQKFV